MSEVNDYWKPELEKSQSLVRAQGLSMASMAQKMEALEATNRRLAAAVVDLSNPFVMQPMARTKHAPAIAQAKKILGGVDAR